VRELLLGLHAAAREGGSVRQQRAFPKGAYDGLADQVREKFLAATGQPASEAPRSASGILAAYADGGVIGRNPSLVGGTWAWCHVSTDLRVVADPYLYLVQRGSGLLLPEKVGGIPVSNNHSEYYALARCLKELPEGWSGTVYSDSQITLGRFFLGWRHENVPPAWEAHMRALLARLGEVKWVLLDGHPTRAQLAAGKGKRGNPCSSFNVWCDSQCTRQAREMGQS
jgi:hypothetical protein